MPRPLRIEYEDACYHVMNRGANRKVIFESDNHRNIFLTILDEIVARYKIEIHAFCLMNNHYHLLVRTPFANLSKAMKYLDGVYTQRFNRLTERDGPIFRGRYKAIIIESDQYFLQVSRYIHLNPVVADLCKNPFDYKWSSYRSYFAKKRSFNWLSTTFTLEQMIGVNKVRAYMSFIAQGLDLETMRFYSKKKLPSIYGTEKFIEQQLNKLNSRYSIQVMSDIRTTKPLPSVNTIINSIMKYFNISRDELLYSKKGIKHIPKMISIYLLSHLGQIKHKQIAEIFSSLKEQSITTQILRLKKMIEHDDRIEKMVARIIKMVECEGGR